jgi:hypothetical protein
MTPCPRFVDRDMSMRYRGGGVGHLDRAQRAPASVDKGKGKDTEPEMVEVPSREEFEALRMRELLRKLMEEESDDDESSSDGSDTTASELGRLDSEEGSDGEGSGSDSVSDGFGHGSGSGSDTSSDGFDDID